LPNKLDFSPRKKRWLNWRKKKNKNRRRPLLLLKQLDPGKMVHDDENNDNNNNKNTNTNTTNHPSTLFLLSVEMVEEETPYF